MPTPHVRPAAYLGIDLSLTATGWAVIRHPGKSSGLWLADRSLVAMGTITPKNLSGPARHSEIASQIVFLLEEHCPAIVAIEGYAHGAKFQTHAMGEIGGIIRLALWERMFPYLEIPPKKLKLFLTGDGGKSATKSAIKKAVAERWGETIKDHNQADAFGLALVACLSASPRDQSRMSAGEMSFVESLNIWKPRIPTPCGK